MQTPDDPNPDQPIVVVGSSGPRCRSTQTAVTSFSFSSTTSLLGAPRYVGGEHTDMSWKGGKGFYFGS